MKIIAQSAAVIAISKAIQKKALSGVPAQKVRQIYNGVVSTSQIAHKAKKLEAGQKIKFCMLSGLFPDKGHEEAIRAFQILHAEFPDTTLSIAGDGNDEKYTTYLKNLVYKLDLTASITFLGYIDDPDKVYQQSDILLVCSKNEGMGRVTIEAMGQGLPVIGYEGGGTPELITHQHNGLMYKGGMAKLAEMMQYWILNPASYHQSSQNALATVRKKFTKAQYVESIYRVLKEVS